MTVLAVESYLGPRHGTGFPISSLSVAAASRQVAALAFQREIHRNAARVRSIHRYQPLSFARTVSLSSASRTSRRPHVNGLVPGSASAMSVVLLAIAFTLVFVVDFIQRRREQHA